MESLPDDIRDFITKAKKLRQQQRDASKKYYTNKYKIQDNMSDSQKQEINANITRRKEIYKAKYEANKELYKKRAKEYREYIKSITATDSNEDTTTVAQSE